MQNQMEPNPKIVSAKKANFRNLTLIQSTVIPVLILTSLVMGALLLSQSLRSFSKLEQLYESQIDLLQKAFTQNIAQDVLLGQFGEVHRRCSEFSQSTLVESVFVRTQNGETICERTTSEEKPWRKKLTSAVFFSADHSAKAADIEVAYDLKELAVERRQTLIFYGALMILVIVSNLLIFLLLRLWIVQPLSKVRTALTAMGTEELVQDLRVQSFQVRELESLRLSLMEMASRLSLFQRQELEIESRLITAQIAQQVAHDIRSPLSALNLVAGILQRKGLSEADVLTSAVQRVQEVAEEVLASTREVAGIARPNSVTKVVEDLTDTVKRSASRFGFGKVQMDVGSLSSGLVELNHIQLCRLVDNLLQNSFEAKSQTVTVSCSCENEQFLLRLRDDGQGMPPDLVNKLGHSQVTQGKTNGTGLGLIGAFRRIQEWHGKIQITSSPGQGTEIKITLPLK
ncbi:MAG: HAMP domain-containing histidine kinase [Bdellovibrionales bacterium]|nr:HAMP domain-containing histidine kinase [Bdellovibrionales bacterium]